MNKKELLQIIEGRKDDIKKGMNDISKDFASDYTLDTSSYLSDLISEYSDNWVYIYNYDLLNWVKDNYEYVEMAISEFGIDEKNFNFFRLLQTGQYLQNEEMLYSDESKIIELMTYNYLLDNEDEIEKDIDEKDIDEMIDEILAYFDSNDRLNDIIDKINEYIKNGASEDD